MFCVRTLIAFFFLFPALISNSQPVTVNSIDSLSGVLISKIRGDKKERLYITTDKSIYTTGGVVWFRAFLLNNGSQEVSIQSQTVFVELVNEKNNVVNQILLYAGDRQQPNGRLFLADSLSTGYYWLRAYTKNMELQDTGNFAEQPLYVYNQTKKAGRKNTSANASLAGDMPQVNFYPEGGIMITGAPSVVALRVLDKNGYPIHDSGVIKDSRDLVTTGFVTNKYGLAGVGFEPLRHMKYITSITWNGKKYTYPLPPFNFFAGGVAVSSQKDGSKKVRVLLEDSIYRSDYQTYLVVVSKDSVCFAGIGSGNYELNIPANKFPPGIATFFLFNKNLELLSERNVYVKEGLTVKAEMNKNEYSKRDKAIINVSFADAAGLPVIASCSISVTEDHFIKPLEKDEKHLSDWSLAEGNDLTDEEADLLMLTKNNVYKNIISNKVISKPVADIDSLLYIRGTLKDRDNNPLPGKVISLFTNTGNNFFETDTTDDHGRFTFPLTDYPDSTMFTMQSLNNTGKPESWKTVLDTFKFPNLVSTFMRGRKFMIAPDGIAEYIDSSFPKTAKILLQPVIIRREKQDELEYDKSKRISTFSHIVLGKDIQNAGNGTIGNAMLTVPGLKILNGFLVSQGPTYTTGVDATSEPMVVVDGTTVAVPQEGATSPVLNYLNSLDRHTIDFIEVLTGSQAAAYGLQGGMGVILVNTTNKYRQDIVAGNSNTLKTFFAKGYQEPPIFTMPSYDTKKQDISNNTDLRSTIYWNGNILSDKNGKAMITFYNNDVPGKYTVTIRGITSRGYVIYKTITYEIK